MTLRYLAVVLLLTVIGTGLLGMRQQQLNDRHAIAQSHAQMRQDREKIKDLQVRIAKLAAPEALQEVIDQSGLQLEPVSRKPAPPSDSGAEDEDEDDSEATSRAGLPDPPQTTPQPDPRDG